MTKKHVDWFPCFMRAYTIFSPHVSEFDAWDEAVSFAEAQIKTEEEAELKFFQEFNECKNFEDN